MNANSLPHPPSSILPSPRVVLVPDVGVGRVVLPRRRVEDLLHEQERGDGGEGRERERHRRGQLGELLRHGLREDGGEDGEDRGLGGLCCRGDGGGDGGRGSCGGRAAAGLLGVFFWRGRERRESWREREFEVENSGRRGDGNKKKLNNTAFVQSRIKPSLPSIQCPDRASRIEAYRMALGLGQLPRSQRGRRGGDGSRGGSGSVDRRRQLPTLLLGAFRRRHRPCPRRA